MQKNKYLCVLFAGIIVFIFAIYNQVLHPNLIYGGDYITYWPEHQEYLRRFAFSAWDPKVNFGWGTIGLLHYAPYSYLLGITDSIIPNTAILERIFWWFPFIIISTISISYLFVLLFKKNNYWIISPLIFLCNTYVLMLIGGGQIAGVGLAYAIAPLVLLQGIRVIDSKNIVSIRFKESLFLGILISVQVMFDLRIVYITLFCIALYFVFSFIYSYKIWKNAFWVFIIPGILTSLLHAFWLVPMMLLRENPIQQFGIGHTTEEAVNFLSFAQFEHTFSLLHPNWPENLFGKVNFMKAEFLLLPIVAFTSLMFVHRSQSDISNEGAEQRSILFFVFIGLFGVFLAKGANDPFGEIYLWMFNHIPGFVMFRDSTKWYLMVAISYAVLIPWGMSKIYEWLSLRNVLKSKIFNLQNFFIIMSLISFFILFQPVFLRQLPGTFRQIETPSEYNKLNTFLNNDSSFGRTLWLPSHSRFADYKINHPSIFGTDFFNSANPPEMINTLGRSEELVRDSAIEYVIVPFDPLGDLFIRDRKYNDELYKDTLTAVQSISWLEKEDNFNKIGVFKVTGSKDHFWSPEVNGLTYKMISPTKYIVHIPSSKDTNSLIFSERYDPGWVATTNEGNTQHMAYKDLLNRFILPTGENYSVVVSFTPQQQVNKYLWISVFSFIFIIFLSLYYIFISYSAISTPSISSRKRDRM